MNTLYLNYDIFTEINSVEKRNLVGEILNIMDTYRNRSSWEESDRYHVKLMIVFISDKIIQKLMSFVNLSL